MSRFIKGESRSQITLFPEAVDEYIEEDNPVRVIDVFVGDLDLSTLGFKTAPADTGRPAYYPGVMLKLFIYGYLNRVQSSSRLERVVHAVGVGDKGHQFERTCTTNQIIDI